MRAITSKDEKVDMGPNYNRIADMPSSAAESGERRAGGDGGTMLFIHKEHSAAKLDIMWRKTGVSVA